MMSDESKCVNCQRCVSLCPTRALKIVKSDCTLRENANWQNDTIKEIYKQAGSGGVLLSSMGNPKPLPVYWDKILINASQVTNPPIDPLREPMETRVFLGKRPENIRRDENGDLVCDLPPQIELSVPLMFSAMSYGSISYNAHESLARAAEELGILYNTGEGGLHEDFYKYGKNTIVQVASGRFGVGWFAAGGAIAAVGLFFIINMTPYMNDRIAIWQNPWSDMRGDGYQTIQSLYAIGSGGLLGVGLGNSRQKFLYIPEPQNDFVFSIVCEELGYIGAALVLILFALLIIRGYWLAIHARDRFGALLIVGVTTQVAVQVFLNIGVVTNLFPVTGISLPFFSYGGTALLIQLLEMGIVLSVSRQIPAPKAG